jgi:predicted metal-dependent phosphoesterase TrpH
MKLKGLLHVHSNHSDGALSLAEIKKACQLTGVKFVFMADHMHQIESLEKFEQIKKECLELSDNEFQIVPGFEVETKEDYHILVYNSKVFIKDKISWRELFNIYSNEKDVLFVLAHASQLKTKPDKEFLTKINAIEAWNSRYDSRHAPNLKALTLAKENNLASLCGVDSHSKETLAKIWLEVQTNANSATQIIHSIIKKDFTISNGITVIDSKEAFNLYQKIYFWFINLFYAGIRKPFVILARKGFKPPVFLKKFFHKIY